MVDLISHVQDAHGDVARSRCDHGDLMALNSAKSRGPKVDAEPVSRILYGVAAANGHSSRPAITGKLKRPTRKFGAPSRHAFRVLLPGIPSLFDLAPRGVCHAPDITARPVRSYRTFSPLPGLAPGRYILCGTFRLAPLKAPSRTLSGTPLCGVRTFLSLSVQPGKIPVVHGRTATVRFGISHLLL